MGSRKSAALSSEIIPDNPLGTGGKAVSGDLFGHGAVASEVLALASAVRGHANIALQGSWGAGKSSIFGLMASQKSRFPRIGKFVMFDAWSNVGSEFQSNFLHALHGGDDSSALLFGSRRTVAFDPLQVVRNPKRILWIAAIAAFVWLVSSAVAAAAAWAGKAFVHNYFDYFGPALSDGAGWFVGASFLGLLVAVATELSKITVEDPAPAQSGQFRKIFGQFVDRLHGKTLLVFIDELDRCEPEDIVAALRGLRTFLGHKRAVFVVAFDRSVVLTAIAQHPRPAHLGPEEDPYFLSAAEFLDKVFQYQVALPPSPPGRTRTTVRSLLKGRGGVWESLRERGSLEFEQFLQLLVPHHIQSPRRIKVLLNAFVMATRLADERKMEWRDRSNQVAFWSTLQLEFPWFADAITQSNRTLRYVVAGGNEPPGLSATTLNTLRELRARMERPMAPPSPPAADKVMSELPEPLDVLVLDLDDNEIKTNRKDRRIDAVEQQYQHLIAFLKLAISVGTADIDPSVILVRGKDDLRGVRDIQLVRAVDEAAVAATAETARALADASDADREASINWLLDVETTETALGSANILSAVCAAVAYSGRAHSLTQSTAVLSALKKQAGALVGPENLVMNAEALAGATLLSASIDDDFTHDLIRTIGSRTVREQIEIANLTLLSGRILGERFAPEMVEIAFSNAGEADQALLGVLVADLPERVSRQFGEHAYRPVSKLLAGKRPRLTEIEGTAQAQRETTAAMLEIEDSWNSEIGSLVGRLLDVRTLGLNYESERIHWLEREIVSCAGLAFGPDALAATLATEWVENGSPELRANSWLSAIALYPSSFLEFNLVRPLVDLAHSSGFDLLAALTALVREDTFSDASAALAKELVEAGGSQLAEAASAVLTGALSSLDYSDFDSHAAKLAHLLVVSAPLKTSKVLTEGAFSAILKAIMAAADMTQAREISSLIPSAGSEVARRLLDATTGIVDERMTESPALAQLMIVARHFARVTSRGLDKNLKAEPVARVLPFIASPYWPEIGADWLAEHPAADDFSAVISEIPEAEPLEPFYSDWFKGLSREERGELYLALRDLHRSELLSELARFGVSSPVSALILASLGGDLSIDSRTQRVLEVERLGKASVIDRQSVIRVVRELALAGKGVDLPLASRLMKLISPISVAERDQVAVPVRAWIKNRSTVLSFTLKERLLDDIYGPGKRRR